MWLIGLLIVLMLIVGTTVLGYSLRRAVVVGLLAGFAVVLVVNVVSPTVCLQQAKGWRILVAYKVC